ncbi:olfactory receptor 6N1-like [Pangasianodon hypophthalmus]|uniref:olfactory receptor 6N1-like n=1 Tax=Pangasianodon hypophthalmus TaxID=310915 RepID=UPI00230823DE|nr:olfactory receptor 6N1-like [Pangasianodon hypophthalmus]
MLVQNDSGKAITELAFVGFDTVERPLAVGVVMLILYTLAITANTANICFIVMDKRLHQPMYIFICHLAIVDMVYCTSSCPTMIGILLFGSKTISYKPCILQMFVFHLGAAMEMFAIAVMAFDRFFAIGSPLWYPSVMTNFRCFLITVLLWLVGASVLSILPASLVPLPVCYSTLKYMFCDYAAIIRTTCVDPEPYFNNISVITTCIIIGTFGFICLSYIKIVIVVLKMSIKSDKKKAIHTCLSHVIVIVCFYAPTFIRVVLTRIGVVLSLEERNGLMVGSIIGPSLVNPFVYCFRTEEIRKKLFKIFSKFDTTERRK